MRVTLTRRLGQNEEGATVDVSTSEGTWLVQRGYAIYDPSQDVPEHTEEDESDNATEDESDNATGDELRVGRTTTSGSRGPTATRRKR